MANFLVEEGYQRRRRGTCAKLASDCGEGGVGVGCIEYARHLSLGECGSANHDLAAPVAVEFVHDMFERNVVEDESIAAPRQRLVEVRRERCCGSLRLRRA